MKNLPHPIEWIAHRGASADAPENTLGAIELAWRQNADAVEIDVRLTLDGHLVLCHDEDAKRVANSPKIIANSTLAELSSLDFGAGERLTDINSAINSIPAKKRLFVEIKIGLEAFPPLVQAIAETRIDPSQLAIISFNPHVIRESKRQLPTVPAYWLTDFRRDGERWWPDLQQVIAIAREIHADGVDLCHNGPLNDQFVAGLKSAGLSVYVWTVDDPAIARRMIDAGVDGITSNRAAMLRDQLYSAPNSV